MRANRIHKSKFARLRRRVSKFVLSCKFYKNVCERRKRKAHEKRLRRKVVKDI